MRTSDFDTLALTCRFDDEQVADLRRSAAAGNRSGTKLREAVERVVAERAVLADESGIDARRVAIDWVHPDGDVSTLIARGEILVRRPGARSALPLLRRLGFTMLSELGELTRLRRLDASAAEVLNACRALRELGVTAGPNHVVAAGKAVRKGLTGDGAARPTVVDPGSRPVTDRRGAGVTVAVVDSGIEPRAVSAAHGWLDGVAVTAGAGGNVDLLDAVPVPDGFLDDGAGHGTFVAGIVRQVAPACDVVALRALESDGLGTEFAIAECLAQLAAAPAPPAVVNLSMACTVGDATSALGIDVGLGVLFDACPDVIVVAAAGNDGCSVPAWPAAHKRVLAVGALDGVRPVTYSNRGYWVDYAVPADAVVSTFVRGTRPATEHGPAATFDGDYAAWSGTSFAAPQIAGAIAALLSEGHTPRSAMDELRRRTTPVPGVGRAPRSALDVSSER